MIINARIAGVARTKPLPVSPKLSNREIEVLSLVARGEISSEIARKLCLSRRTIDFHTDNARIKLRGDAA